MNEGSAIRKEEELLSDSRLQILTVALPSATSVVDWDKYKEYLYANLRLNTARPNPPRGKKEPN